MRYLLALLLSLAAPASAQIGGIVTFPAGSNYSLQVSSNNRFAGLPGSVAGSTGTLVVRELKATYGIVAATVTAGAFTGPLIGNADTVTTNANLTGPVTSVGNATTIIANAIDTSKLATDSVTGAKILDSTIDTAKLNATIRAQLAASGGGGITALTGDVAAAGAGSVTATIQPGVVDTGKIAAGSINTSKLTADAVTTVKILNLSVDTNKLATDSVTGVKILNATIDTAKLNATIQAQLQLTLSSASFRIGASTAYWAPGYSTTISSYGVTDISAVQISTWNTTNLADEVVHWFSIPVNALNSNGGGFEIEESAWCNGTLVDCKIRITICGQTFSILNRNVLGPSELVARFVGRRVGATNLVYFSEAHDSTGDDAYIETHPPRGVFACDFGAVINAVISYHAPAGAMGIGFATLTYK